MMAGSFSLQGALLPFCRCGACMEPHPCITACVPPICCTRRPCRLGGSNALVLPAKPKGPKASQDRGPEGPSRAELRKLKQVALKRERREQINTVRPSSPASCHAAPARCPPLPASRDGCLEEGA